MADTPSGETATPKPLENNSNVPSTPAPAAASPTTVPTVNTEDAVAALRKEKEQAEMRANQLANQLKEKEEAEAAAKAKSLEEQNEFKTLYEQSEEKRKALEAENEAREARKVLRKAEREVLEGYSDEVKALAKEVGLELTQDDDESRTAFKEKLDKISGRVGTQNVGANNPNPNPNQPKLEGDDLKLALKDPAKTAELLGQLPTVQRFAKKS